MFIFELLFHQAPTMSPRQASRKSQLKWSTSPLALVAGDGYVAALLPGRVEVKSVSRISAPAAVQVHFECVGCVE
jgi:hypothetical protein